MLTVCTWLWGSKFGLDDVAKLAAGVKRNLNQPHRFILISDRMNITIAGVDQYRFIRDMRLTKIKGCFARLRMFDPVWQDESIETERLACIDLDTVVTGNLDPLFDRPEPLVIMQGANRSNPCPFNGALMMLRRKAHPEVWQDFDLHEAGKIPFYEFPDDQGWIHHKVPDAAGWPVGEKHGVYVWQKRGWPGGESLPDGARLVTFVNKGPRVIEHLPWVQHHWRV